jgi:hypothetical protein
MLLVIYLLVARAVSALTISGYESLATKPAFVRKGPVKKNVPSERLYCKRKKRIQTRPSVRLRHVIGRLWPSFLLRNCEFNVETVPAARGCNYIFVTRHRMFDSILDCSCRALR